MEQWPADKVERRKIADLIPYARNSRLHSDAQVAQIAANIAASGENPTEFIDTKLSVAERKYSALPEAWRKGFKPARTVKMGALKVTLEPNEVV